MQRIVRRVEVERDPLRRGLVGGDSDVEEDLLHCRVVDADLAIPAGLAHQAMLQAVERRLAGECLHIGALGRQRVGHQTEHRFASQLIVVIEILIAEGLAVNALRNHRLDGVHNKILIAVVAKAARDPRRQTDRPVRLTQQHRAAVRRHRPAVESAHNLAALEAFKVELARATVCLHRSGLLDQRK